MDDDDNAVADEDVVADDAVAEQEVQQGCEYNVKETTVSEKNNHVMMMMTTTVPALGSTRISCYCALARA